MEECKEGRKEGIMRGRGEVGNEEGREGIRKKKGKEGREGEKLNAVISS